MVQWLKLCAPKAKGPGLIAGWGRSCMLHGRVKKRRRRRIAWVKFSVERTKLLELKVSFLQLLLRGSRAPPSQSPQAADVVGTRSQVSQKAQASLPNGLGVEAPRADIQGSLLLVTVSLYIPPLNLPRLKGKNFSTAGESPALFGYGLGALFSQLSARHLGLAELCCSALPLLPQTKYLSAGN